MTIRTMALRADDGSLVNRFIARWSGVTRRAGCVLSWEVGVPGSVIPGC